MICPVYRVGNAQMIQCQSVSNDDGGGAFYFIPRPQTILGAANSYRFPIDKRGKNDVLVEIATQSNT